MVFKRKNQPFKDLVAQAAFIGYIKMVFHIRTLIYLKHRSIVYYIVCAIKFIQFSLFYPLGPLYSPVERLECQL